MHVNKEEAIILATIINSFALERLEDSSSGYIKYYDKDERIKFREKLDKLEEKLYKYGRSKRVARWKDALTFDDIYKKWVK